MKPVALSDVCDVIMGQAPPGDSYNDAGLGIPLLAGAGDFGDLQPNPKRFTTKPTRLSDVGDILLCVRATIGERTWSDQVYCLGRGVAALRTRSSQLDSGYLWHWLPSAAPALQRRARGSTFKQVTRDAIESLRVALPPLAEQRRLAAMLDKADAIRRKRREAIRLLEEFLRAAFLEMFGDPVKNPKGWEVVRLGEVGEVERGKFTPRPRNDPRYYGGPHPFIQTGDIAGVTGYLRCWKQTLNDEGVAVSRRFGAGTICISIAANIGDTAILTFDSYFPDSVVGITVDTGRARTEFVEYALRFLRPRLSASAPQTAQRNINLKVLRPLRIPVPPVSAQDRFGDLYRRTYGAATRVERGIAETDALFNSLAQQAFGGSQRPRPK